MILNKSVVSRGSVNFVLYCLKLGRALRWEPKLVFLTAVPAPLVDLGARKAKDIR